MACAGTHTLTGVHSHSHKHTPTSRHTQAFMRTYTQTPTRKLMQAQRSCVCVNMPTGFTHITHTLTHGHTPPVSTCRGHPFRLCLGGQGRGSGVSSGEGLHPYSRVGTPHKGSLREGFRCTSLLVPRLGQWGGRGARPEPPAPALAPASTAATSTSPSSTTSPSAWPSTPCSSSTSPPGSSCSPLNPSSNSSPSRPSSSSPSGRVGGLLGQRPEPISRPSPGPV